MVKKNKRKKGLPKCIDKRPSATPKVNPFDMHYNRKKRNVLGDQSKHAVGTPGVSRSKALRKRQQTLLPDYLSRNKTNVFIDKRIGQYDASMSEEARAAARFTAYHAKNAVKNKRRFALDDEEESDEEILTHRGRALSEIEKFEEARSDDDDDDNGSEDGRNGRLGADFVKEAHFGGGLLRDMGSDGAKSYGDHLSELINESKRRKLEKQKNREQTADMVDKLDALWDDGFVSLLQLKKSKKELSDEEKRANKRELDKYDRLINKLALEEAPKPAADKLKSEEDIAKEEKRRLERLEKERLERMQGFVEKARKHRSADALDDDYVIEDIQETTLSYNEKGEPNIAGDENWEEEEGKSDDGEDEEMETESEDDYADLEEEKEDENNVRELRASKKDTEKLEKVNDSKKTNIDDQQDSKGKVEKELPFTYTVPETYEELSKLLASRSPQEHDVILERTIKCNHPGLSADNKKKLELLFIFLLQYIRDICEDLEMSECYKIFTAMVPHMYDLAKTNVEATYNACQGILKELQGDYRKSRRCYPSNDVLLFLKLIGCLFPTSDFRHGVVTPAIIFIDQMLTTCLVKTGIDVAFGLMLVTLILDYTAISKRYLPSAITFLSGILSMAIPRGESGTVRKPLLPFRLKTKLLVLGQSYESHDNVGTGMRYDDLSSGDVSDDGFKIRALHTSVMLLDRFVMNFAHFPSRCEVFELALSYLGAIPRGNYPKAVRDTLDNTYRMLIEQKKTRKLNKLLQHAERPKALKLYEPKIRKIYDTKKNNSGKSVSMVEREVLVAKIRKEKKALLREIRKDKDFLARQQIKEKIEGANERVKKVKRIFGEAAVQQADLKKMARFKHS